MKATDARQQLPAATLRQMISLVPRVTSGLPIARKRVLWRNLVTRFPAESALAAEYVVALLRSESWGELAAFETVARKHKLELIDLTYVDAAIAKGDVAGAEKRLAAFERRRGQSTATLWRRYDTHVLARDFDSAIDVANELMAESRSHRRWAGMLIRKAKFYRALHEKWSGQSKQERDYDLYVVNLDSDTVRLDRITRQLEGLPATRIPGVKGAYLPDLLLEAATRGVGAAAKGTVGCFLSHVATWERVARADRVALVLEDDAWVLAGLPIRLSEVRLPADFDYCFAAESFLPEGFDYRPKTFGVKRPRDILPGKSAKWDTPSTVAYFISPAGARKLLSRVERDGVAGDVDWRILTYSLNASDRKKALKEDTKTSRLLGSHHNVASRGGRLLNSYVLVPGLTRYFQAGSVRLNDNGVLSS